MSESTLTNEIMRTVGGSREYRPLKALTKQELFFFPQANPSPKAQSDYLSELMVRRGIYAAIKKNFNTAKDRRDEAHATVVRAAAGQQADAAKKILAAREATLKEAQAMVDALPANEQAVGQDEIEAHFKKTYTVALWPLLNKFKSRELFTCHGAGYHTFLVTDPVDIAKDVAAWRNFENLASLACQDKDEAFLEVREFYLTRIMPSREWRLRFLDQEARPVPVASLSETLQRDHWKQWRKWARATKRYGWGDDSGCTYTEHELREP